jgi:DNA-binding NarL/FixJ family response regulator
MGRRKSHDSPDRADQLRVLIVSGSRLERMRLASRLADTWGGERGGVAECGLADGAKSALKAAAQARYDLAIIRANLPDGSGIDLAREFAVSAGPAAIIITEQPSLEEAVSAMRSGALDIISCSAAAEELVSVMRSAIERARRTRERDARIERLTRVCRRLNQSRRDVTRQVSSLCGDMVNAYQELTGQVLQISTASEFGSLIRQDLDVESLLRTTLEYVLAKAGPTNAAVFLPATSGDFSLGAYVNYDCPKDTADVMLERMSGVMATRMEHETGLKVLNTPEDLSAFLGVDAHWLADSRVISFACHHDGECLAVVCLFRDRRQPFPESLIPTLRIIADLFGKQLSRVIHIHHRHLPKDQWGGFGAVDEGDDDIDLAA